MTVEELARVVNDSRLTADAVRLVLAVASRGSGEHEIDREELRALLRCRDDQIIYRARELAVKANYLRWHQGGRNHGNMYEYLPYKAEIPVTDTSGPDPISKGPLVVEVDVVSTPYSPPDLKPLDTDAGALIEAERETLGECVKPLVSYLRRRVPPDRQEPYVGRVVGALQPECLNPQWKDALGVAVPLERRRAIMADALNELGTADEDKGRAHQVGDWNNMRNKLLGLIRYENAPPLRSTGTDGYRARAGPREKQAPDEQTYKPTEIYQGLKT